MSAVLPPGISADLPADDQLTPLFRQYAQLKAAYPDSLLLYRLGDFYEMFGHDAVTASSVLGLTLTSRACGKEVKLAMAGVPHHSSARYIKRLVEAGYSCAICEQLEDASLAKGLVERDVTRVVTAGTLVEEEYLDDDGGNFLAVAAKRGNTYGVALLESSGGSVELWEMPAGGAGASPAGTITGDGARATNAAHLLDMMLRNKPREVLLPAELHSSSHVVQRLRLLGGPSWKRYEGVPSEREVAQYLHSYFKRDTLEPFGIEEHTAAQAALYALIRYLRETFKVGQLRLYPKLVPLEGVLHLDSHAAESLELVTGELSLYSLLNRCSTAPGRRLLKRRLLSPFADAKPIAQRHASVAMLSGNKNMSAALRELLGQVPDIERIAQRIALGRSHPREVAALGIGLQPLGKLRSALEGSGDELLASLATSIADFHLLANRIASTLSDDPPMRISDGNVILAGSDESVDNYRELVQGGDTWFGQYEQQQRERTGIRTLKVKRTDAFGWFLEVGRGAAANVPTDYQRRQTLVNNERYSTPELAERDADSRSAGGRLLARERELFEELCADVATHAESLATAAFAAAEADMLLSFAEIAREKQWVRPELLAQEGAGARARHGDAQRRPHSIQLTAARHPLVEEAVGSRYYTPNDCWLDGEQQQVMVLTGPNMGGKSTFLRMVALQCVLAQVGSFVPAQSARLPLLRRIYTRVGAHDRLSRGQSTFMVEMVETAEILNTAGAGCLVILDEVGRGTSTYDGISIAKAVLEHLHEHPARPLVLFATHFFELTDLELALPRVKNFHVEVVRGDKDGAGFVFLYKVNPGPASDSFGIEVAALAGLPDGVVTRARQILAELEEARELARERARNAVQLGLFRG
ncbi:MAG: DNA mismatch repair protein MutS [bacterium]|nr:DNA mismatch repair protein MutS [bacterium]